MFVDRVEILVTGGVGGDGCSALHKEPYQRYPRPSGGPGGDGGDVSLVADSQLTTLLDFHFRHEFRGERGRHGTGNGKNGRRGADTLVRVPAGTIIYDAATGHLLRDLVHPADSLIVARGGTGGSGNIDKPHRAIPGKPGEQRKLRLELKLIADVGLIGFPNAGKSSLLARISTARPKVASYPFTTRTPGLGVVSAGEGASFVACDIPGLIEGAHEGKGLGIQFLRHIERTKLLVHVVDMASVNGRDPVEGFVKVNEELAAYNPMLSQRPQIVAANKMDLTEAQDALPHFRDAVGVPVYPISCATGAGIPELVRVMWSRLRELDSAQTAESVVPSS